MEAQLTSVELPDLSDWKLPPLYTIEQAALLWGGIDPSTISNFQEAEKIAHPAQYRRACIARQAFLSGIILRTLTVQQLFLVNDFNGSLYPANQKTDSFSIDEVCISQTLVMRDVLIEWAKREQCYTLRQTLSKNKTPQVKTETITQPETTLKIESKPLQPSYPTPEFEVACTVVKEYWNKLEKGKKPPKEAEIQDFIAKTLEKHLGCKPSQAAITRVDTLTRPQQFKNRQKNNKVNG
ncbi:MAG: hypothetical protein Q4A84_10005 [Neisseria sp.]|uniref:hypothetical protein n=1 Tax=Neisseria sp. TaxID=192066 RepID=UPI0026DC8698|nr:hypothetical protein [Neisseria sp.]MDO4642012.1 hypothetical protein [Neisseria sp.]